MRAAAPYLLVSQTYWIEIRPRPRGRARILAEIEGVAGSAGLRIERDQHFTPNKTLGAYADEATRHQRIIARGAP